MWKRKARDLMPGVKGYCHTLTHTHTLSLCLSLLLFRSFSRFLCLSACACVCMYVCICIYVCECVHSSCLISTTFMRKYIAFLNIALMIPCAAAKAKVAELAAGHSGMCDETFIFIVLFFSYKPDILLPLWISPLVVSLLLLTYARIFCFTSFFFFKQAEDGDVGAATAMLFISNLGEGATESALTSLFSKYPGFKEVSIGGLIERGKRNMKMGQACSLNIEH